jgi:RNA polymerase sigma-70 factor (ECF subfamily)
MTTQANIAADDYALMEKIRARDAAALDALWKLHSGLVMALCLRSLGDRQEAEDLTVDIFHELWQKSDRYDPTRASPKTYLVTLARSRAVDRLRSRASRPATSLENEKLESVAPAAPGGTPAAGAVRDESREKVRAALAALEPMQRAALEAAYFDGLSHAQIADKMAKPLGTVKGYIRLAMIQLRDTLRTQGEDTA